MGGHSGPVKNMASNIVRDSGQGVWTEIDRYAYCSTRTRCSSGIILWFVTDLWPTICHWCPPSHSAIVGLVYFVNWISWCRSLNVIHQIKDSVILNSLFDNSDGILTLMRFNNFQKYKPLTTLWSGPQFCFWGQKWHPRHFGHDFWHVWCF